MKKILSVLLCLCVLCTALSTVSLAAYEDSLVVDDSYSETWIVDVTGDLMPDSSEMDPPKYYQKDEGFSVNYSSYSMLDKVQKYIYDAVLSNVGKLSFTIEFPQNFMLYSNWNGDYFARVMHALCVDRPDLFYYAGYGYSGGTLYNKTYVKSVNYSVGVYDSSIYTESNLKGYHDALMAKIPQVPVDTSNRYNFIKSVHDYLANTVYYPDLSSSDYVKSAHDAYGALIEGRAVCQGYSDAIKLLCDYYKIPCVCIAGETDTGGGHMWNAVQMDDGKWYFIDCTWDDQKTRTYYDFFLVGTQSTNTYFGGAKFSAEHINDPDIYLPNLEYSSVAYDRNQDHFTGFKGTYNHYFDQSKGYLYLSVFDYLDSPVFYNGIDTEITPIQGGRYTASTVSGESQSFTAIVLGDPDGDGYLTEYDYDTAIDYALDESSTVTDESQAACDVNCDGVVDVLDLALLARSKSGVNTDYNIE